jgi:hypothetical protein
MREDAACVYEQRSPRGVSLIDSLQFRNQAHV